jgi:anthranilate synthase component 2/putative glutamine amidotransferase
MTIQQLISSERPALVARMSFALGGDRDAAEDLVQEAFVRAWRGLPPDLADDQQRAWLHRTARNLAIDELRRRSRRPTVSIEPLGSVASADAPPDVLDAAREGLASLSPHERFLILLRFEAGFAHAEIAVLLETTEEAARKRVARARAAFINAYRRARSDATPRILLVPEADGAESAATYARWLERAGARVTAVRRAPTERELALADGLVLSGDPTDLHPGLYGELPRLARGRPDLARDRTHLALLRAALAMDLPYVGICRGHQLLNVASGGNLYQDVVRDGLTSVDHDRANHRVDTNSRGSLRGVLGRSAGVESDHHQAIRRLGRDLQVTASSPDGVVEGIERTDRRFALGLQWHPERPDDERGARIAEALVAAAVARAA